MSKHARHRAEKPRNTHVTRAGVSLALVTATAVGMSVPAAHAAPPAPATTHVASKAILAPSAARPLMLPQVALPASVPSTYKVRRGDTVWDIARKHGTTVGAIVKANNLSSRAVIYVGQTLKLSGATTASTPATASKPAATSATVKHRVVAGDTVSRLASKYGSSVSAIVKANTLNSRAVIYVGQTLTIPGKAIAAPAPAPARPAPKPAPAPEPTAPAPNAPSSVTHKVSAGETVSALAKRYGTTVAAIVSSNNLASASLIYVGQSLRIPGAGGPVSSAPAAPSPSTGKPLVGDTFLGRTYPADVVASANANKAALLAAGGPSRAEIQALVAQTARSMGVDPALALAHAKVESSFVYHAVSPANAIGTMQVIPSSGEWASQLVGRKLNLMNPQDNVVAGVAIIRQLAKTFPTDQDKAIGAYYQGAGAVQRYGLYPDTKRYVASVKGHMASFR